MPFYLFEHPKTGKVEEVFFHMNDEKIYESDGVTWKRIYVNPNTAIDTQIDPFSAKDFIKATAKPGTYGELLDRSAELSAKREAKAGVDPIKEKYYKKYSEDRPGRKHPDVIRKEANAKIKKYGISIE